MAAGLMGSVGRGGLNRPEDVISVQRLLAARNLKPGPADGICGQRTIAAIEAFQRGFLARPDGRVDPGQGTWQRLSSGSGGGAPPPIAPPAPPVGGGNLTQLSPRPTAGSFNVGLPAVNNAAMIKLFGQPRTDYSQDCQPVTNATLSRNIVTASIGPFRVTGLRPAVDSLRQVFSDIAREQPAVHAALGTAGMLCARFQRDSATQISNHSWGSAIDLTINGVLDRRGDNMVQLGLTLIAPIFNRHRWVWGALFPTEDAMHFEISMTLANEIKAQLT